MNDLSLAIALTERFHHGQKYGKMPYTYHLEAVVKSVLEHPDERLHTVAQLHDILEDTACTEEILFSLFEDNIVKAVIALTKVDYESYEDYIVRVKANQIAKVVKMHDTLCNLRESLVRQDMNRVRKYSKQMQLLGE